MRKKTRIIAFINQKGGCGKTTCCASVAKGLEHFYNRKVLAIDLDMQRNLSAYFGIHEPIINKKSVYNLLHDPVVDSLDDYIIQRYGVDLIASSSLLKNFEIEFCNKIGRESLLKRKLEPFINRWDYICIDTPPSLSLITLQALTTANEIFIVTQAKYFDLMGLSELLQTVHEVVEAQANPNLTIHGIIINMYDQRLRHHKEIINMIQQDSNLKPKLFNTFIRNNISLSEASSWGQPIFLYAPNSNGAQDFADLCLEIVNQI